MTIAKSFDDVFDLANERNVDFDVMILCLVSLLTNILRFNVDEKVESIKRE